MSSDQFANYNYGSMETAQQDLVVTWGAMRDELDDLEAELLTTLSTWSGDAQTAYYQAKGVWDQAATHMQDVLQKSYTVMGDIMSQARTTDLSVGSMWGS